MTSIDLYGQIAAVTGGGRGIGRVTAQTLAAAGATVAVLSRSPSELEESVTLIERAGGRARAFPLDVLNAAAVAETLAEVARALGPLDLLVNNAGDGGPVGPLEETDPALWWHTQEVNLLGPMLCTHGVARYDRAAAWADYQRIERSGGNQSTVFFELHRQQVGIEQNDGIVGEGDQAARYRHVCDFAGSGTYRNVRGVS
jgi:NAD(P)-dependent dehydrogenase (short-subunit alcohol dehydrogenase family)